MEISNLDMETRPSCKSFHFISASKNINFIINNNNENKYGNTIANIDSSNSNDNAGAPVTLHMNAQLFFNRQSNFYIPRLNLNKIKQRLSPANLLNKIFQKFEYITLTKNRKFTILEQLCGSNVFLL